MRIRIAVAELERAIRLSQGFFRRVQYDDGYWWGRLESNSTMEAEYLMLSRFLGKEDRARWNKICRTILNAQREDGSWSLYYGSPGDLSTSVECYFALKLAGVPADSNEMARARDFILSRGGVPRCRVFTKIWLALFGQWDWNGLPHMPPEMIFVPPSLPFSVYDFASWARPTVVPLLIVLSRHPTHPVPEWANLDELFPQPRDQTDYSLPKPRTPGRFGGWGWAKSLYLLNRALGLYEKLPVHPFRGAAERKVVDWILEHQEANGGWAGIQPPWVYCLIALHHMGFPPDHEVMEKGFKGLDDHVVEDEETFFLQGCISPVWDTCLAQIALLDSGVAPDSPMMQKSTRWLLDRQILEPGDWQVRAKNVEPGGWAFEFDNDRYPDIDDTAEVIIALDMARLETEDNGEGPLTTGHRELDTAIRRGVNWVLALQSDSGGWGAFDKNNNRTWVSKLPFSDFGEVLDPSSADVTAHILEMLGRLGYTLDFPPARRAYEYIRLEQEEDGSWFGRWGVNHIYGVSSVMTGLAAIGEDMGQPYIRRAVEWLLDRQNEDGGWGESCGSYVDPALRGVGPSTASQTAWAVLALIAAGDLDCRGTDPIRRSPAGTAVWGDVLREGIERGVGYLVRTQKSDGTWDEPYFTGTGFPGYRQGEPPKQMPKPGEFGFQGLDMPGGFMINYHMYRNYWPLMALGRYARLTHASGDVRVMGGDREAADCRVNRARPVR